MRPPAAPAAVAQAPSGRVQIQHRAQTRRGAYVHRPARGPRHLPGLERDLVQQIPGHQRLQAPMQMAWATSGRVQIQHARTQPQQQQAKPRPASRGTIPRSPRSCALHSTRAAALCRTPSLPSRRAAAAFRPPGMMVLRDRTVCRTVPWRSTERSQPTETQPPPHRLSPNETQPQQQQAELRLAARSASLTLPAQLRSATPPLSHPSARQQPSVRPAALEP